MRAILAERSGTKCKFLDDVYHLFLQAIYANLTVTNAGIEFIGKDLQYTKIQMAGVGSNGNIRKHTVNHVLWNGWPDKSVPISTTGALRLIFRTQVLLYFSISTCLAFFTSNCSLFCWSWSNRHNRRLGMLYANFKCRQ